MRVAVVADFAEERWPSMDLVADALVDRLRAEHAGDVSAVLIRPRFTRRFTRTGAGDGREGLRRVMFNADRLLNRFLDYPRLMRRTHGTFDVIHITDHSYAHLVRHVAAPRVIVTCHDLDAFRSLIEPSAAPRSKPFRMMAARVLSGLGAAAMVACDSAATRDEVLRHHLVAPERTVTIANGVAAIFRAQPDPQSDREAERMLGPVRAGAIEILHVGSTIARKRIDVLLRTFAGIRAAHPAARLVRVSGPFMADQARLARELGVEDATAVFPFVEPAVLASIYRRAGLVMITSEHEGFGLPLVEAMACGVPVLASDLAVLREVGGDAAEFAPVGDVPSWTSIAMRMLCERANEPARWSERGANAVRHAAQFSWSEYARRYVDLYRKVASSAAQTPK